MPERLRFDIEQTNRSHRLTLNVPASVLRRARATDGSLDQRVAILDRQKNLSVVSRSDEGSLKLAVNTKAIGRKNLPSKLQTLEEINVAVGSIIGNAYDEEADPDLTMTGFFPLPSGDFGFGAIVALPNLEDSILAEVTASHMLTTAQTLRHLPLSFSPEAYEDVIRVDVSNEEGIGLSQGTHSSVHTMGQDYIPGCRVVELVGNNVTPGAEPLIYLVGVTALARAQTLVGQPTV